MGKGSCRDSTGRFPRVYWKPKAFSTISECRDLCTILSAACVGYRFAVSLSFAGECNFYGSALPDKGTGAAAPGKPLDGWGFNPGTRGSDTLTRVNELRGWECHAKQPGASGMHPSMPSSPLPVPASHVLSPYRVPAPAPLPCAAGLTVGRE